MRNSEFRNSASVLLETKTTFVLFTCRKAIYGFLFLALTVQSSFGQSAASKTNDCTSCTCICIQGSLDFSNIIESGGASGSFNYSSRVGFNFGVFTYHPLKQFPNDQLLLRGGLQYIQKGSKYSLSYPPVLSDASVTLGYLEIPIDILYQFQLGESGGVYAGFGPYFAYGLGGQNKFKYNGYPFSENSFSDSAFKRFDAGLHITAGYRISCTWSFSIAYELGLVNIVNSDNSGSSAKNQVFSINIAYCLGRLMHNK